MTRGSGVMTRIFDTYGAFVKELGRNDKGALISMATGPSTAYALAGLEPRGILFIGPGESVSPAVPLDSLLTLNSNCNCNCFFCPGWLLGRFMRA